MSTILEALKRVEEQLRNEALQKTAGGAKGGLERPNVQSDSPAQTGEAVSEENDEVMKVYLSLVDMIARIEDRVQQGVHKEGAKARKAIEELAGAMALLKDDLARQKEMLENVSRQQEAEREAGKAALAAAQSQIDPLRLTNTETQEAIGELARLTTLLQQDLAHQKEALKEEARKREADDKAASAASAAASAAELKKAIAASSAATQSQVDSLKKSLAETSKSSKELAGALTALRNDLARQQEALQEETRQRNVDDKAGQAALAATQSQTDSLKQVLVETKGMHGELVKTVAALRDDLVRLGKAHNQEVAQREAEDKAGKAALAATQSQTESLKQALAETRGIQAESAKAIAALRDDLVRLGKAHQQEAAQREAKRKAGKAAFAAAQSEMDSLEQSLTETRGFHKELAQAVAALRDEFAHQREALQKETQKRDAEAKAREAALAAAQSQIDSLRQTLADHEVALASANKSLSIEEAPYAKERWGVSSGESISEEPGPSPTMDADEAQRLHRVAGDAYARGDYAEALHLLDIIDAAFPDNKSILYNQVECLIGLGRNDDARRLCDYLVKTLKHKPAQELRLRIKD